MMDRTGTAGMSFAGKVWRLLVGIKDGLTLLFLLLFFATLFAILSARPSVAQVRDGALLLKLDGVVVEERSPINPFTALLASEAPVREFAARDLVRAIDAAAADSRMQAVVLDLDRFLGGGQVHLREISDALARVRAAEKPVFAFATLYSDDSLLLAANANEIWVDPLGGAAILGPGGNNLYFGALLDRLNITARVYRVGTYKAAVEPWTQSSMSPEARENAQALYGSLWEEWQTYVQRARPRANLPAFAQQPAQLIAANGGSMARAALQAGIVDHLGSRYQFEDRVAKLVGEDKLTDTRFAHTALQPWLQSLGPQRGGRAIGVVTVAGTIVDGEAGPGTAGGTRIAKLLDDALDDELAGLVLRVDSPGGSVLASEEIRRAVERHRANGTPVAVSMANVAASGGYWVATPAQRIFAEPETITGSIGVFAVFPTFERLAQEYGVGSDGVSTTPLSGQPDLIGGLTPEVESILQSGTEETYRTFLQRVSQSRNMTVERADSLGQGRVWDGGTARQVGLVDQYGGVDDALAWVAAQAKLGEGEWHPTYLGENTSAYDTLLRQWLIKDDAQEARRDVAALAAGQQRDIFHRLEQQLAMLLQVRGMQAYCMECPVAERTPVAARSAGRGWMQELLSFLAR
nr:signal peptide peptidase SppA [Porphyrobacter sp. GA68]